MAKSDKKTCPDRRDFLKFAGSGAIGGAAVLTGASAATASDAPETADDGYRESEHVKTYYKLARF